MTLNQKTGSTALISHTNNSEEPVTCSNKDRGKLCLMDVLDVSLGLSAGADILDNSADSG